MMMNFRRNPEVIVSMNFNLSKLEIIIDLDMTLIHSINPNCGNNKRAMEEELERIRQLMPPDIKRNMCLIDFYSH
jgi:hypothetical protein